MRISFLTGMLLVLTISGCARGKTTKPPEGSSAGTVPKPVIVTPENVLVGIVALVNLEARYVVLTFASGQLPGPEQRLNIYRRGMKVGEVKVSGSASDRLGENIVANLTMGEAQKGDEVKER